MIAQHLRRGLLAIAAAVAATAVPMAPALAAEYPDRPVTLVVPFPPGGPTDALARRLAEGLRQQLGQPVLVENKGGAGGNIGADHVAKAKADGYTLLFGTSGPLAINAGLYPNLTYHPQRDFAPIVRIGHLPNILAVHPSVPAKNLEELVAFAKSGQRPLFYASSGNGASSHLAGVLFNQKAGTQIEHVPYRGTGPALTDLLGGQVDMVFTDVLTALPYVKSGQLNAIGLTSSERSQALPDLPTLAEQGLEGYDVSVFFGIVAPAATPEPVVSKLNAAFRATLDDATIEQALAAQGIVKADDQSPAGLKAFIDEEVPKWATLIQQEKIAID